MVRIRIIKEDGIVCSEYNHLADTTTLEDLVGIFAAENELEPDAVQLKHHAHLYSPMHNPQDARLTLTEMRNRNDKTDSEPDLVLLQVILPPTNMTNNSNVNESQREDATTTTTSNIAINATKTNEAKPLVNNLFRLMQQKGILSSAAQSTSSSTLPTHPPRTSPLPQNAPLASLFSSSRNNTNNNNSNRNYNNNNNLNDMNEEVLDENSIEVQEKLYKAIQQANIDQNYLEAMEETPESFVQVPMLYIKCTINNVPLNAFIDTGAQKSIMTPEIAEKCNLSRLIDRRMSGVAIGVGQAKIIGRIHMTLVEIDQLQVPCGFMVVEGKKSNIDLIFGLDQMRRHCMIVDLKQNALRIGETNVSFLSELEIPPAPDYSHLIDDHDDTKSNHNNSNAGITNEKENITHANKPIPTDKNNNNSPTALSNKPQNRHEAEQTVTVHANNPTEITTITNALSQSKQTKLRSLMAFTGITNVTVANELLEASAWDVDQAAGLFFNDDE